MTDFLNESEKELQKSLLLQVTIDGKDISIAGVKKEFSVEPKNPEKLKNLLTSLLVRGMTIRNLRDLKDKIFQSSKLEKIGMGGVTVDDGLIINTTLLSDDAISTLFKIDPHRGQSYVNAQLSTLTHELTELLNNAIDSIPRKK